MSSATARSTNAYKLLLARVILGETRPLTPVSVVLGDGAFDSSTNTVRPPAETMYHQTGSYPVQAVLSGSTVHATATVATGNGTLTYNEIGVLTSDGTLILHRTLAPQVVGANLTVNFSVDLLPPEVS